MLKKIHIVEEIHTKIETANYITIIKACSSIVNNNMFYNGILLSEKNCP